MLGTTTRVFSHKIGKGISVPLAFALIAINAFAQGTSAPSSPQCRQWDDAYLAIFYTALWGTLAGTFILNLALPALIGKYFWWATAPRLRILWITSAIALSVSFAIGIWPRIFGFGQLWFSGIDPRYLDCETTKFGAEGLLWGLISSGVPAVAQWPAMIGLLVGASGSGGVFAFLVSNALTRYAGIESRVEGEAR